MTLRQRRNQSIGYTPAGTYNVEVSKPQRNVKSLEFKAYRESLYDRGLTNRAIQDRQLEKFGECNTLKYLRENRPTN